MDALYEKSIRTLELPTVLDMLAYEAVSASAQERALALRPVDDLFEARARLRETTAACAMMTINGSPSFSGVRDVRPALSRADLGGSLNTRELLDIAGVLCSARLVKAYGSAKDGRDSGKTDIDYLFHALQANRFLEDKILGAIPGEDEIADSASAELADIRRRMRAAAARAREALQKIISSPLLQKALQEALITTRSDRYVVPVKAEHKGAVPGLVHDVSSSGATLFIEPMAAVKANNEVRELKAAEKTEIERILAELSADCAGFKEDIESDFNVLVALDLIFAKAKLSYKLDCAEPELSQDILRLRRARHPLLEQRTAVPLDVTLGGEVDTLVITGPNTGGKTVALKTLGLLSVMALCGLHIPAKDGSAVPVYSKVLADIGDEQSIEQSLSTFSSHMTNIVGLLRECDGRSLLLFDELGAGTDPTEGAALAISVVEYARHVGAKIAATTHYAELKIYATNTPGVQNASCEFDVETLRPTYRLLVGIPGKSNAFAISLKLGLPEHIIEDAKARVGTENASFEATIEKLERQRQVLERDADEAAKKLREAEENARKAQRLRVELEVKLEKAEEKGRREAARIVEDARRTAEAAFAELDRLRELQREEEDHKRQNEARAKLRRDLNEAADQLRAPAPKAPERKSSRPLKAGDAVTLLSAGVRATVINISPDGMLSLQAGIMRVTAKESDVLLIEDTPVGDAYPGIPSSVGDAALGVPPSSGATLRAEAMRPEL
ncbi:MAG: endonuclease MutS2, partial [Firmicutes bacterium]|nr:endonuclease MutS2 [Bacillota bacterium]